jgi:hypothetical protein
MLHRETGLQIAKVVGYLAFGTRAMLVELKHLIILGFLLHSSTTANKLVIIKSQHFLLKRVVNPFGPGSSSSTNEDITFLISSNEKGASSIVL